MKRTLVTRSLLALVTATLFGCGGGGSDSITTSSSASGSAPIQTAGTTSLSDTALPSVSAMANLSISGSVQGVAINSPPVVTFQLVNSDNNTELSGLDQWSVKKSTDKVKAYTNFAFSIAKLVPGTNGSPSKWVSYMVSSPTFDANGVINGYTPGRPGSENNGVLKYLGNGQYQYEFRRDITKVPEQLAGFSFTGNNKLADLGDLRYDKNAVHRLVIQFSGAVRGATTSSSTTTSCNTSSGSCASGASYEFIRTPVDLVYDWIPATGRAVKVTDTDVEQREIVNVAACATCHNKFTFHTGGNPLKGWAGGRQETRQCVVCHTDQRKYGQATSTTDANGNFPTVTSTSASTYTIDGLSAEGRNSMLDMPVLIHKIHMGEELTRTGYNIAGVKANDVKYPQLIVNCAKCHSGDATKPDGTPNTITKPDGTVVQMATAQGNNWNTKPNRLACGACHDGINFNTGNGKTLAGATTGHGGGGVGEAQADDSKCATCHSPAGIKKAHVAVTPQDKNSTLFTGGTNTNTNAAWLAANPNNLPAGAIKVSYDVKSVSRDATSKNPVMVFRILQNGARKDFNAPPAVGTANATLSNLEMWDNFMGAPSAYFVFAVPQDGIAAPADFNATASGYLRSIWNGKASGTGAGTMTGPDAEGYYTVTLTGVTIPDSAVMLTGGLGYTYAPATTMPLTQTNLADYPVTAATATISGANAFHPNRTGGLIVVAPEAPKVGTGYTGRREIVEDKRCNNCHQELGAFNASQFHAGQRNDGATCSWCHNPNRTSSAWSADSTNFIHGIHAAAKRTNQFTWHAASTADGFWSIGYPGVLKNCEACHKPGSYDFSNADSRAASGWGGGTDKRLFRYSATGTFKSKSTILGDPASTQAQKDGADLTVFAYSPFVATDTSYGAGFGFNAGNGATTVATGLSLLETPTATVCFSCHDDNVITKPSLGGLTAKGHMLDKGAKIYAARGATNPVQSEQCFDCHSPSGAANIKAVHSK